MNQSIIEQAEQLAFKAHEGQLRKDGVPYIDHPKRVAELLHKYGYDDEVVAAGWLHDVVEDTSVGLAQIESQFGKRVASLVEAVSENPALTNNEERKRDRKQRAANGPAGARAIAVADSIDNLKDLVKFYKASGHDFWKKWPISPRQKLESSKESLRIYSNGWADELLNVLQEAISQEEEIVNDYYRSQ